MVSTIVRAASNVSAALLIYKQAYVILFLREGQPWPWNGAIFTLNQATGWKSYLQVSGKTNSSKRQSASLPGPSNFLR